MKFTLLSLAISETLVFLLELGCVDVLVGSVALEVAPPGIGCFLPWSC
jgi:hypothetical protein